MIKMTPNAICDVPCSVHVCDGALKIHFAILLASIRAFFLFIKKIIFVASPRTSFILLKWMWILYGMVSC